MVTACKIAEGILKGAAIGAAAMAMLCAATLVPWIGGATDAGEQTLPETLTVFVGSIIFGLVAGSVFGFFAGVAMCRSKPLRFFHAFVVVSLAAIAVRVFFPPPAKVYDSFQTYGPGLIGMALAAFGMHLLPNLSDIEWDCCKGVNLKEEAESP